MHVYGDVVICAILCIFHLFIYVFMHVFTQLYFYWLLVLLVSVDYVLLFPVNLLCKFWNKTTWTWTWTWTWHRWKKTSKLCVTGLCEGNSPVTGEFPAQMASNAENVSIWWHHHGEMHSYFASKQISPYRVTTIKLASSLPAMETVHIPMAAITM